MNVNVIIAKGQSLRMGILSGNMKSDGTVATDNSGWFKVDNFRIEKKTIQTETSLSSIQNSSFVRVLNTQNGVYINVQWLVIK